MRTISVPSGVGDNIWILSKLINTGEKFIFNLPDGIPQRGKQVFDLLPDLVHSSQYVKGLSYKKLAENNIQNNFKTWKRITAPNFCLSMNHHLESGQRIETFFPDLATSYRLPYKTEQFAKDVAKDVAAQDLNFESARYELDKRLNQSHYQNLSMVGNNHAVGAGDKSQVWKACQTPIQRTPFQNPVFRFCLLPDYKTSGDSLGSSNALNKGR